MDSMREFLMTEFKYNYESVSDCGLDFYSPYAYLDLALYTLKRGELEYAMSDYDCYIDRDEYKISGRLGFDILCYDLDTLLALAQKVRVAERNKYPRLQNVMDYFLSELSQAIDFWAQNVAYDLQYVGRWDM